MFKVSLEDIEDLRQSIGDKRAYALALKEKLDRLEKQRLEDEKGLQSQPGGLIRFIRYFWGAVEPGRPLIEGWPLDAICDHLEAVTYQDIRRLLINVCPGFMKALCCDTPVLTTWGWKRHGDLRPGDFVFGQDGSPKRVLANTNPDMEESYEVEFDDGTVIVAGAGHLWEVERDYAYGTADKRRCRKTEVVTTRELIPSGYGGTFQRPDRIRLASPVSLPPKRLLIDPYRYVTAVRPVGPRLVNCITVEGQLYLAGKSFVTTHNSMCANVFWPAWEWGPIQMPFNRFIAASYSQSLTLRDNVRFRNIIMSPEYVEMYGSVFGASKDQFNLVKVANDKTGWKLATSVGGVGTGERGDRFVIDDGNSVKEAESEAITDSTNQWFLEVVPTRLNDAATGAIINIQQRTGEEDISGTILAKELNYEHLVIRMEYDSGYDKVPTCIGWVDPRKEDGELAWPERFPRDVVDELKDTMGPYAVAGQFQQSPEPRGGGILKREYWQAWEKKSYPQCDFVLASLDPAFTQKETRDPSGFTIWGSFLTEEGLRAAILLYAFRKRLEIMGPDMPRHQGETDKEYRLRCQGDWGLVETVHDACKRFSVDHLIVENKASGLSIIQAMAKLFTGARYSIQAFDPKNLDKTARMIRVQPEFSGGQIYAPFEDGYPKSWAGMVIDECAGSANRRYWDLTDSTTQAIWWLRTQGFLERREEQFTRLEDAARQYKKPPALYPV